MYFASLSALVGALAVADVAVAAGLYGKNSAVMQVDGKDFDKRIKYNDKASIVE